MECKDLNGQHCYNKFSFRYGANPRLMGLLGLSFAQVGGNAKFNPILMGVEILIFYKGGD